MSRGFRYVRELSKDSERAIGFQNDTSDRRSIRGMPMKARFGSRRGVFSVLVCALALLLCVPLAQAQSAGTGALTGTVTDAQGGAVAGVTVTATTGPVGDYKFSLLPPGNYRLKFAAPGFKTSEVGNVTVTTTETATVNQA